MIIPRPRSGFWFQKIVYVWIALFCAAFGGNGVGQRQAKAGSVHIHWAPDAPERLQAANVLLYEELVAYRDADPTVFDKHHPFFAGILTDPAYMNQIVARWQAHEQRFEYWHPYLWRILDGYEFRPDPAPPPPIDPPPDPGNSGKGDHGGGGSSAGGGGGAQPDGGGGKPSATPEPSSLVLWIWGFGLALLGPVFKKKRTHR